MPRTFVRESYCFWESFWFQKVLWMKRGVSRFSVRKFWSHSAEKFRGHPFNVSESLGYRKILCIIGGITSFRRKFFCLTVPKNFVGMPSMSQKNLQWFEFSAEAHQCSFLNVLICISTFELHAKSNHKMFHFSTNFCTIDLLLAKLLVYIMLNNICLCLLRNMFDNM